MSEERNINFKEIPNTFLLIKDRTSVLKRKVLLEKVEKTNENSIYAKYFASFMEGEIRAGRVQPNNRINIIEELEKPRILFEKDLYKLEDKRERIKKRRKFIDKLQQMCNGLKVKSLPNDITSDITSLENIDFNSSCTEEQKEYVKKQFDYYVLTEAIDEINCEIKNKEIDGVDLSRMHYSWEDEVSKSIKNHFIDNQTIRLPENYMELYSKNLDYHFNLFLRRKVLVEKTGYNFFSWEKLGFDTNTSYRDKMAYFTSDERALERKLMMGEFHRRINMPSDMTIS